MIGHLYPTCTSTHILFPILPSSIKTPLIGGTLWNCPISFDTFRLFDFKNPSISVAKVNASLFPDADEITMKESGIYSVKTGRK